MYEYFFLSLADFVFNVSTILSFLSKKSLSSVSLINSVKSEVISFEVDDISMRLNEVYRVASAMMNLLQDNDIYSLCDIVYPDLSNWMWSDSDKQVAKELWRIE